MKKFFLFIALFGCHDLSNRHDPIALQCDVGVATRDHIVLQFTNPGGINLSLEQLAQLQVKYESIDGSAQLLAASSKACVVVPPGSAQISARISGEQPLKADLSLSQAAVTGTIVPVEMSLPSYLSLKLKCPKNGLLASDALNDVIEVKDSLGNLQGYQVDLSLTDTAGRIIPLYKRNPLASGLSLPHTFDLRGFDEGAYVLKLAVQDSDRVQNQCDLTIRRSCAKDEDFDPKTISCVPRLCDNTFRVGAQWKESLRLQRGEGSYECRLVGNKAEKILLSHSCRAGFFKSADDCLSAKKIENTCALLENDDVACWGTQIAKNIWPQPARDLNFQKILQFPGKVLNFDNWCVELEGGKVVCWEQLLGDQPGYQIKSEAATPKAWAQVYPKGFVSYKNSCGVTDKGEFWCSVDPNGDGGYQIPFPETIVDYGVNCMVDIKGHLWCYKSYVPGNQAIDPTTPTAKNFVLVSHLPGPVLSSKSAGFSSCALMVSGQVLCWGDNSNGTLGANMSSQSSPAPVAVVDSQGSILNSITQLTAVSDENGSGTYCALHQDGRVLCWGSNLLGYLANGTPGEDDEGNPIFSRFAVPVTL